MNIDLRYLARTPYSLNIYVPNPCYTFLYKVSAATIILIEEYTRKL